MNEPPAISVRDLTRYYGSKPAVEGLNLDVPRGSVFAFLGRNGSGKTTTIRMLLGLVQPTRGRGSILGHDIRNLPTEARARIGYLTEEHQLYGWMNVRECGEFQSRFYPRWNEKIFRSVAGHFNLQMTTRVKHLSRGERAGLCLGLTLAPEPELLIMDDPTLGLDPVASRALIESMIFLTRRSGRTIFFSSHQLADVERVADKIAILDRSVLRVCCPLETFRQSVQRVRLRFSGTPPPPVPAIPGLLQAVRTEGELRLTCVNYGAAAEKALRALAPAELERVPLSLEDAFISYLGDRGEKSFILAETESETEAQP
jgi:ABC-2 type transport system ATP-binding protein